MQQLPCKRRCPAAQYIAAIREMVESADEIIETVCDSARPVLQPENAAALAAIENEIISLTEIELLDNNIDAINDGVFSCCIKLRTINIPNGVTKIGHFAFSECVSLKSICLSKKISYLGGICGAFEKCDKLIITTTAGSYAEEYAKKMKIRVRLI